MTPANHPVSGSPLSEASAFPPPATRGCHLPPEMFSYPYPYPFTHLCTAFLSSGPPVLGPSYLPSSGSAAFTPAGNSPRSSNAVMVALKVTVPALPRSAVMERLPMAR